MDPITLLYVIMLCGLVKSYVILYGLHVLAGTPLTLTNLLVVVVIYAICNVKITWMPLK